MPWFTVKLTCLTAAFTPDALDPPAQLKSADTSVVVGGWSPTTDGVAF